MIDSIQIENIKKQFSQVITYSQNIKNPKIDKLFDTWYENKRYFIDAFQGQLIYELPSTVQVNTDIGGQKRLFHEFCSELSLKYHQAVEVLLDFIQEEGFESFFTNSVTKPYQLSVNDSIDTGIKLLKSFKFFIADKNMLKDIQDMASRYIQKVKISGKLCLSVHPLDFLSISETNHNWRSCHALDGEYRAGNLSYMSDKSTVVCYLKSDQDDVILPDFPSEVPWNDKKWRVLLYFSNDHSMILASKQYPMFLPEILPIVQKCILQKVFTKNKNAYFKDYVFWSDWSNQAINSINQNIDNNTPISASLRYKYVFLPGQLIPLSEIVSNGEGAKQYNDILNNYQFLPYYTYQYTYNIFQEVTFLHSNSTRFEVGGYTYCLNCGEYECSDGADTMMCNDCELMYGTSDNDMFTFCSCCGQHIYTDDGIWLSNNEDDIMCEECFNKYAVVCECCGDHIYKENAIYDAEQDKYYCSNCAEGYDI